VRSAAAKTLGRLGADTSAQQLLQIATSETNGEVRASLVGALAAAPDPPPAAIEWASVSIRTEPDENARYNMALLLGSNLENFPGNRAVLEALLEVEQSRRIRQQVADMLY
jgi:HEAT repeat protein